MQYLRGWTDGPDTDTGEAHAFTEGNLTALCGAELSADREVPRGRHLSDGPAPSASP